MEHFEVLADTESFENFVKKVVSEATFDAELLVTQLALDYFAFDGAHGETVALSTLFIDAGHGNIRIAYVAMMQVSVVFLDHAFAL